MLIDWFTVGAQALNFLILVWLMKHFLYKPILNAIDARDKKSPRNSRTLPQKRPRPKGPRRVPAQERGIRPAARRALKPRQRTRRKPNASGSSTKRGRLPMP
jgi:hypothetical protein